MNPTLAALEETTESLGMSALGGARPDTEPVSDLGLLHFNQENISKTPPQKAAFVSHWPELGHVPNERKRAGTCDLD